MRSSPHLSRHSFCRLFLLLLLTHEFLLASADSAEGIAIDDSCRAMQHLVGKIRRIGVHCVGLRVNNNENDDKRNILRAQRNRIIIRNRIATHYKKAIMKELRDQDAPASKSSEVSISIGDELETACGTVAVLASDEDASKM